MKCFYKQENDAVAVCVACGKALCPAHTEEVNNMIYCKDNAYCRDYAVYLNKCYENHEGMGFESALVKINKFAFLMHLVVAFAFLVFAILAYVYKEMGVAIIFIILSAIFVGIGIAGAKRDKEAK